MSNTENQESVADNNNTTEARLSFADKAEKLLRTILVALGYENAGTLRGEDIITSITAWVTLLITMKREPGGSYASFWARAFLDAWRHMSSVEAAESATAAVNEFAKRYPPMFDDVLLDEQERDTQLDIQALTAELDKQVQLVWQLESENKALLKANQHHAAECVSLRERAERAERCANEFDELIANVWKASKLSEEGDLVSQLEYMRQEYDRLIVEDIFRDSNAKTSALVPLAKPERVEPGQRWARIAIVDTLDSAFDPWMRDGGRYTAVGMLQSTDWLYLGTDKV